MRAALVLTAIVASLMMAAACADSEGDSPSAPGLPPTSVPDATTDASTPNLDADVPDTRLPDCSSQGWCITAFPDEDLVFRDVWVFDESAFAIAESDLQGVKILEWKRSTNTWEYIDDTTQNGTGVGTFAGAIYAPNVDNVYFTVGPSYVYHGVREAPPGTKWSWTRRRLPDNVLGHPTHDHGNPVYGVTKKPHLTFGVWGSGETDVYAYYSNTVFRREPETAEWTSVYIADDLESDDEDILFASASGTGPDDVMFVGARERYPYNCPVVVRKTAAGWERLADGVVSADFFAPCGERAGTLHIGGSGGGWLTAATTVSATEHLALQDSMASGAFDHVDLTRLRTSAAETTVEQSRVPFTVAKTSAFGDVLTAMWRGQSETWFTAWGLVLRGTDDGAYSASTISRDGAPVAAPLYRIRGTSNHNLWAVGARHAFHKTTP